MVWPIVAVAAASAAAQYYQSEKARGASEKRLKELEAEFRRLVPPDYDLSPMDPPAYIKETIGPANYDFSKVTPDQYKLIGKYTPEIAPLVAEQNPQLVKDTAAGREGRDAQIAALRKMRQISTSGSDPELAQALDEAGERSQVEAQSRAQSTLQDANRRGMLGSGTALAAELQGNSDAMEGAAKSSRDATVAAYKNKLAALRDSSEMGGRLRSDELNLEAKNAGVINDFNERTSRNRQAWGDNRANTMNNAQRYNLDSEQDVSNNNIRQGNEAKWRNQDNYNTLTGRQHEQRTRERDNQNDLIGRTAAWRSDERDRNDNLKDRMYKYDFDKLAATSGIAHSQMQQNISAARDKNQAIQGVTNAGTSAYMHDQAMDRQDQRSQMESDARNSSEDRADRRAYFEKYGRWEDE